MGHIGRIQGAADRSTHARNGTETAGCRNGLLAAGCRPPPRLLSPVAVVYSEVGSPALPSGNGTQVREILIVTRDPGIPAVLALALRGNLVLHVASSVSGAFRTLGRAQLALGILDIRPDDPDAVPFLRMVSERCPGCELIVLDCDASAHANGWLLRFRIAGVVPRPVELETLLTKIYAILAVGDQAATPHGTLSPHVTRTLDFVAHHYAGARIGDIARAVGISKSYLARRVRLELGMTLRECVTVARTEVAKYLLAHTPYKLEAIAERAGFCDASHLSRVFRHYASLRPGQYRAHARGA